MDNLMKDDEYHFSEGGSSNQSYGTAPVQAGNGAKRRKIFTIVATVIVVFLVVKILGHARANKQAEAPIPAITPAVKPAPEMKPMVTAAPAQDTRFNSLENKVNELSGAMTGVNQQLQNISAQLQSLASSVAEQQSEIASLRAPKKIVVKKIETAPVVTTSYVIQAMIPGRAWLNASDGTTLTVRSGDQLPGFGTVMDIDPSQGMIATSSGRVLTYSSDDS